MPAMSPATNLEILEEVRRRRTASREPSPDATAKVHAKGLLTARERIEMLIDPGSEWGFGYGGGPSPIRMGFATIHGRPIVFKAHDATVGGGAYDRRSTKSMKALSDLVEKAGLPLFYLFQGAGGKIDIEVMSSGFLSASGHLVAARKTRQRRGAIYAAILGNAFAPWAVAVADFSVMTKRATATFVSPFIVEQATGRKPDLYEMGGWEAHSQLTGQICQVGEDEADAIEHLRTCFGYLPSNAFEEAPRIPNGDPPDRRDEALATLVPPYPNRAYDVRKVIERVVDRDSFYEWQGDFGKALVSGLARMDGYSVVIMAHQPAHNAGTVDTAALTKARRITELARNFSLPVVSFVDTPGVMTTQEEEHKSLLSIVTAYQSERFAAELRSVTVLIGKGIGQGLFILGSGDPEGITLAWPNTQIAYLGSEGGAAVVHRREIAASEDPRRLVRELAEPFRAHMNPWRGSRMALLDDIIDPAETRPRVIRALEALRRRKPGELA